MPKMTKEEIEEKLKLYKKRRQVENGCSASCDVSGGVKGARCIRVKT